MCKTFRQLFLTELEKEYQNGNVRYHLPFHEITKDIKDKRWVVHTTRPSMDTDIIENYLARYINRIAISQSRIKYVKQTKEVHILYHDYKNQAANQAAPKAIKTLDPLVAIDQIIQHTLPARFQKSRSYGLHNASNKIKDKIEEIYKRNPVTVRTVMEIITHLMGLDKMKCQNCGSVDFQIELINRDKNYITSYLKGILKRGPPQNEFAYYSSITTVEQQRSSTQLTMPKINELRQKSSQV
jgi:hypothetical protein